MNIVVLHGDDVVKSRARLDKFIETAKGRGWEVQWIDKETNLTLAEVLSGGSLFQKERLFVVDDISILQKQDFSRVIRANLVIYNDGYIPQGILKLLPQPVKIEEFRLPKIIFDFLSSFYPGNAKNSIGLLHKVAQYEPIEFVFSLLAKQLRDLYWVKVDGASLYYPAWRISRLKNQSKRFTQEQLVNLVSELAKIDIETKTSKAKLTDSLDLLIASRLE